MKPLILGTAQFGQLYGITNVQGPPAEAEIKEILALAWENGVNAIDTAAAYGNSEAILGRLIPAASWRVISKIPRNKKFLTGERYGRFLRDSIYRSLSKLDQQVIDTLLVHSATDLLSADGRYLYDKLRQFQSEGLVKKVGVSIYTGREIEEICQEFRLDVVQLPISILDQRLIRSSHLQLLQSRGIEVHARSIFLQGLLLTAPKNLPEIFDPIKPHISRLNSVAASLDMSMLDLCIGFVSSLAELDGLVIGVESTAHLKQILRSVSSRPNVGDMSHLALEDSRYLHPGAWASLN